MEGWHEALIVARDLDLHADGRRLAVAFFDGAVRTYGMDATTAKK